MDISTVSSNTFVQQVSGVVKSKHIENFDVNEDVNVVSSEEKSQNIGNGAVRSVERGSESNVGSGVDTDSGKNSGSDKQEEEIAQTLDVLV